MIKIKYRFSFYRQNSREKVRKISAHDPSRHVPIVRWLERIAIRSWRPKGKGFRAWVNIFRSPGSLWQCQHRSKSESWTAIVANQMRSAIAWGWNAIAWHWLLGWGNCGVSGNRNRDTILQVVAIQLAAGHIPKEMLSQNPSSEDQHEPTSDSSPPIVG